MPLDGHDPRAIAAAARALRSGALLGLPTETVYGLAADAGNDTAVAQIFAAKGRPRDRGVRAGPAGADPAAPARRGQRSRRRPGQRGPALPGAPRRAGAAAGLRGAAA